MKKFVVIILVLISTSVLLFSQTWEAINFNNKGRINQVYSYSNYIYVSSYGLGIYYSQDNGSTWTKSQVTSGSFSKFIVFNDSLYCSSQFDGILASDLQLKNITKKNVGLSNNSVLDFILNNNIFYLSLVGNGIMYSSDTCNTWKLLDSTIQNYTITSISKNDNLFVATALGEGVLVSTDSGENWELCKTGLQDTKLSDCEIIENKIFVTSYQSGVYISTDYGKTFQQKKSGLLDLNITTLSSSTNNIVLGTNGNGVFTSSNYGESWTKQELTNNMTIYGLDFAQDGKLIIGTSNGGIIVSYDGYNFSHPVNITFNSQSNANVRSLAAFGNLIFAGSDDKGLIRSVDEGNTWLISNDGLPLNGMYDMDMIDNILFASIMNDGVYYSTNYGNTWKPSGLVNTDTRSLLVINKVLYAASTNNGIYKSADMGKTWEPLNAGFNKIAVDLLQVEDTVFMSTWSDGIYYSSDSCGNWSKMTSYTGNKLVVTLIIHNEKMYAGTYGNGLYSYDFNTKIWTQENFGDHNYAILSIESNLFTGNWSSGVHHLKKNSNTFEKLSNGLTGNIMALTNSKNYIFAGSYYGGIFRLPLSVLGITVIKSEIPATIESTLVYPNPANDFIKMNVNQDDAVNYEIYDLYGRKLLKGKYQNHNKIDISALNKGVYFIKFNDEFCRFIKN